MEEAAGVREGKKGADSEACRDKQHITEMSFASSCNGIGVWQAGISRTASRVAEQP